MLRPAARLTLLVCLLTGCAGAADPDDRRARRARQMRDVSRMLDAMEHPDRSPGPREAAPLAAAPPAAPAVRDAPRCGTWQGRGRMVAAAIGLGLFGLAVAVRLARRWHRRRHRSRSVAEAPSSIVHFAEAPVPTQGLTGMQARPTWIYRTSPYETPLLHMVPAPVDLLPPWLPEPSPTAALAMARAALQRARSLTGSEADEACSFALMHAFLAEQEPSLRAEATACRQAVTALYEALPHRRH